MRYVILLLATFCLYAEDSAQKSPATLIYEKALADNAQNAEKAFNAYWKELEISNAKVIKALEDAKVNLNDPKKGSLSISDRAKAIMELDEHIKAIKGAAINDLLVENKKRIINDAILANSPAVLVGKWTTTTGVPIRKFEFNKDGTGKGDNAWPIKWKIKEGNIFEITYVSPEQANHSGPFEVTEKGKAATFMRKGTQLENFVFTK